MRLDEACAHIVDCEHKTAPIDEAGEYFAVGTPAMRDHCINYAEARRISQATFEAWTRRLSPQAGDLLLAREAPVGPIVRLPSSANVAPGQRTVLLRPDPSVTSSDYLYYLLRSPRMQSELLVKAEGSTVHHLNVADIRALNVTLPPLPEQQAIAEVLGALDDKIAANTRLAATADAVVRSLVALPHRADSIPLSELFTSPRVTVDPTSIEASTPYVGLEHVPRRSMWLNEVGIAQDATSTKSAFERGDVLFGKLRPYFHKVATAPFSGVCSTDILVLRARETELSGFASASVASDSVVASVTASSEGTRMPRASWKDLAAVDVPWPGRTEALRISREIASIREAVIAKLAENRTLAATRDTLLPKLMSGAIRVRDAEATAAEML
ncbi:restriction endonuclease subunit S [Microbacterium sp. Mu-80]|uniref:Restriction endonuclease subunit S n=1 Tax=Microbacterium bandirmense TaxID=3122050 RepID=A0ABU8L7G5_9MICO